MERVTRVGGDEEFLVWSYKNSLKHVIFIATVIALIWQFLTPSKKLNHYEKGLRYY